MGHQEGGRSWLDCVRAGEPFVMVDPDFMTALFAAKEKVTEFNAMPVGRMLEEMAPRLSGLFGKIGEDSIVLPHLTLDVGFNIEIGSKTFINQNATLLDTYPIRIGSRVLVAPNCAFYPTGHPIRPADRFFRDPVTGEDRNWTSGATIVVEDDVWIGGNCVILPGVTIGRGSMIGAGSVVTKSVPPAVFAAGNPCRVIRQLD